MQKKGIWDLPAVIINIIVEFAGEKIKPKNSCWYDAMFNCIDYRETTFSMYGFMRYNHNYSIQSFIWYYTKNCLISRLFTRNFPESSFCLLSDDKRELKLFRSRTNPVIKLTIRPGTYDLIYDDELYSLLMSIEKPIKEHGYKEETQIFIKG